jgi:hypothetical protein
MPSHSKRAFVACTVITMLLGALDGAALAGTAGEADALATAEGAVLSAPDLPTDGGWTGTSLGTAKTEASNQQLAALSAFPSCRQLRSAFESVYAAPNSSSRYQSADGSSSAANTVAIFDSVKEAKQYQSSYGTKPSGRCFREYWASLYDEAAEAKVQPERFPASLQRSAGGATGVRLRADYLLSGEPTTTYFDFVVVRRGDGVASFTFSNNERPMEAALERRLMETVADRLGG